MFRPNFAAQESLLPSNGHAIIANLHEYRNSDSPFRTTFARNASAETPPAPRLQPVRADASHGRVHAADPPCGLLGQLPLPDLAEPAKQGRAILVPIIEAADPAVPAGRIDVQFGRYAVFFERVVIQDTVTDRHHLVVVAQRDKGGRSLRSHLPLVRRRILCPAGSRGCPCGCIALPS